MKKFIVLYHASAGWDKMKDATLEDMKEGEKQWMAWAETCGDALVDFGAPLNGGQKVTSGGTKASDKNVVGYSVLQTSSMDEAVRLLEGHPHLKWADSCDIEVHEATPMHG